MIGKLLGGAALFFCACLLIAIGAKMIASIWWIPVIILAVITFIVIYIRIQRNKPKW